MCINNVLLSLLISWLANNSENFTIYNITYMGVFFVPSPWQPYTTYIVNV